jgi:hypothetical protein
VGDEGRRSPRAADVLSELRLALVQRRLVAQPIAADGAEAGEIATAAVQGKNQAPLVCAFVAVTVLMCTALLVSPRWSRRRRWPGR